MEWISELGFEQYRSVASEGGQCYRIVMLDETHWRAYRERRAGNPGSLFPLGTFVSLAAAKNACGYDHAERDA